MPKMYGQGFDALIKSMLCKYYPTMKLNEWIHFDATKFIRINANEIIHSKHKVLLQPIYKSYLDKPWQIFKLICQIFDWIKQFKFSNQNAAHSVSIKCLVFDIY